LTWDVKEEGVAVDLPAGRQAMRRGMGVMVEDQSSEPLAYTSELFRI